MADVGGMSLEEARIQEAVDQAFRVLDGDDDGVSSTRVRFFENLRQVTLEAVAFLLGVILARRR